MQQTMIFSLVIRSAPTRQSADSAYRFASAALDAGHELYRLFFYGDGVHNANSLAVPPQDEQDNLERWQQLGEQHGIDMVVCVASALGRGLLDEQEARRYSKPGHNLAPGFVIGGLGQLLDAAVHSDRVITFG